MRTTAASISVVIPRIDHAPTTPTGATRHGFARACRENPVCVRRIRVVDEPVARQSGTRCENADIDQKKPPSVGRTGRCGSSQGPGQRRRLTDIDTSRSLCSDLNSDRLTMNTLFQEQTAAVQPLALRPKDAATALGISERLLYDWAHFYGLPIRWMDHRLEAIGASKTCRLFCWAHTGARSVGIDQHQGRQPNCDSFEAEDSNRQDVGAENGGAA